MIVTILTGMIAGWLAGKIMGFSEAWWVNILLGLAGGAVGGFVLGIIGLGASSWIGGIVVSVFGACLLVWLARKFR